MSFYRAAINLKWECNQFTNSWHLLNSCANEVKNVPGVYMICSQDRFNNPIVIKIGESEHLRNRISNYNNENHEDGEAIIEVISAHGLKIPVISWAYLPGQYSNYRKGVERFLGDYYRPLIAQRFPAVAPIAVNLPF